MIKSSCRYLMEGDFFIGASMATTLTKLALRFVQQVSNLQTQNQFCAEAMLVIAAILHLGRSGLPQKPISNDDAERLGLCLKVRCQHQAMNEPLLQFSFACQVLSDRSPILVEVFTDACRRSISLMLAAKAEEEAAAQKNLEKNNRSVQADDLVSFKQLLSRNELGGLEDVFESSLSQALVGSAQRTGLDLSVSKLNKVTQLTGFSDPVYAEAYVNVNQYDIVLDVLIVNQTADTLQNCTLELATLGDLKLVEKPSAIILAPHDFANIKASVKVCSFESITKVLFTYQYCHYFKVASTENGIIFGNIVYDVTGSTSDRNVVVLNDIHIDIMDYIMPASCTDAEFRQMWADFEWENKVTVNTNINDLNLYLQHLLKYDIVLLLFCIFLY